MKYFFLKTALLITLLLCAVLYGMDLAKQGMMRMEGVKNTQNSSSPLNFEIPGLGGGKPVKPAQNTGPQIQTTSKPETKTDDLQSRITKLNQIHGFNPFSSMGDKLSEGVSSVFEHGIDATASVINRILK